MLKFLDLKHFLSFDYHHYKIFYTNKQSILIQYVSHSKYNRQENKNTVSLSMVYDYIYLILYWTNNIN